MKKLLLIIGFLLIIAAITIAVIFYANGYRPNIKTGSIDRTGIVSIRSNPDGATIFIDGLEKGTTDLDLSSLKPGKYKIMISKEGFTDWEDEVEIKKEKVNVIYAFLFPKAPSLSALTYSGVTKPIYSQKSDKVAFAVQSPKEKAGIWVLNLESGPIPSFFSKDLVKVVSDTEDLEFSKKSFQFSPDGKQILIFNGIDDSYYLVGSSGEKQRPKEVTLDIVELQNSWREKEQKTLQKDLGSLGIEAENIAANLTGIVLSPKKEKFIGKKSDGSYILFDKNPGIVPTKIASTTPLPKAISYNWFAEDDYILLVKKGSISVFDIENRKEFTIYTGEFDSRFSALWPDSSQIVISTNLNKINNTLPNLYAIKLR